MISRLQKNGLGVNRALSHLEVYIFLGPDLSKLYVFFSVLAVYVGSSMYVYNCAVVMYFLIQHWIAKAKADSVGLCNMSEESV